MTCNRISTAVLPLLLFSAALDVHAAALNIDFGTLGIPSSSYGAAAGQAGVWNEISSLGLTSNLLDLSGNTTSVSLSLSADTTLGAFSGTGDTGLLRSDNFFSGNGNAWSFVLTNLANGTYSFYYYAPANTIVRTGAFLLNGVAASNILGNQASTLIEGSDWEVVTGVSVTNGTLNVASVDLDFTRGLAGVQLVQTSAPEPSMPLLTGTVLGIGWLVRRRKRGQAQA